MGAMAESQNGLKAARRALYVVTLWVEQGVGPSPVWRGSIETADGGRAYFASLTELNRLLIHKSGWIDPAPPRVSVDPHPAPAQSIAGITERKERQ